MAMKDGCDPITSAKLALQLGEPLPQAAERVHPHAVAGGWRVWKCHFRGWQHLRAVKIFPLARAATYGPKRKRALFFYKKRADLALSR